MRFVISNRVTREGKSSSPWRDNQLPFRLNARVRVGPTGCPENTLEEFEAPWVFASVTGTALDEANVRKAFNRILDAAELDRRGPHQMPTRLPRCSCRTVCRSSTWHGNS